MARVFKPANFSLLPQTGLGTDPWAQDPVQSGHCFASNGDEFSGGDVPKVPEKAEAGRSITAREGSVPVAWSNREELHALVEKIPEGQRFSFFCRNIEGLTHEDIQSCLDNCFFDSVTTEIGNAEESLVYTLRDILQMGELTWRGLPRGILNAHGYHEPDALSPSELNVIAPQLLSQLAILASEFDSTFIGHMFPIARMCFNAANIKIRIKAVELAVIFEANLTGAQASMAREEIMNALTMEEEAKVRASLIHGLGEIGSRNDHGEHLALAGAVTQHLADDDERVRIEVIQALVKIVPLIEDDEDESVKNLQNLLRDRIKKEKSALVREWLRTAITQLVDQLSDDAQEALLESVAGLLRYRVEEGQEQPPWRKVDRLGAINALQDISGRSSRLDNRIAATLEEFWEDVEPEVRGAAFEAWSEVIQNLEPKHVLERAEAVKKILTSWSSDVVHLIAAEGLGKLIPLLDVEKRLLYMNVVWDWMYSWLSEGDNRIHFFAHVIRIVTSNLENLKLNDQQMMAKKLSRFLWEDNRHIVCKQLDDLLSAFESIGRYLSRTDLNDLIAKIRKENKRLDNFININFKEVLAVLEGLPQRRHYEAAVIKAAVRRVGVNELEDDGKGYLNRGLHRGSRPTKGGFDFRDLREVKPGEPIGRIDPAATARTGNVHERVYHLEQSRPVMIVVDPESIYESDRNTFRYFIGSLAQFVIAQRDPVGLIIGEDEVYIKPSHGKDRLYAILTALHKYRGVRGSTVGVLPLLEQRAARMNMPRGSEVFIVSPFAEDDLNGVERVIGRLKKRGVNVRPIKVKSKFISKEPVIKMGGVELKVDLGLVADKAFIDAKEKRDKCERFLKKMGGFYFDLKWEPGIGELVKYVARNLKLGQEVRIDVLKKWIDYESEVFDGEFDGARFDGQMPTIDELMQRTYALEEAKISGNGHVFSFVKDQLDTDFGLDKDQLSDGQVQSLAKLKHDLNNSTSWEETYDIDSHFSRERWGVEDVTYALDEWTGEKLPLHEAIAFGPSWLFWKQFQEMYKVPHKIKEEGSAQPSGARKFLERLFDRGENKKPNVPLHRRKSSTPDNTGASEKEKRDKDPVWQKARKLTGRYLRNFVGVDLDSAHAAYRARDGMLPENFDIDGNKKAVGRIVAANSVDEKNLPRPSNGKIDRVKKKGNKTKVYYRLAKDAPEEAQQIMGMKLSAFRAAAAQMYGAELYAALTDSLGLEDVNAFMRDEWRALIEGLDDMTVGEAMRIIQGYIINHPKITYHRYTEDPLKESAFSAFQERAREGGAKGKDEYVQTSLSLGGGVCAEHARIATCMLRLAGLPAAYVGGYMVEAGGRITTESHAWSEVVFPNGDEMWHGEIVEATSSYASASALKSAAAALEKFRDKLSKSKEEKVKVKTKVEEEQKQEQAKTETEVEEKQEGVSQPQSQSQSEFSVEPQPALEVKPQPQPQPAFVVEPERMPIEDVLHRLPQTWSTADAQRREQISGWVGSLPAIMQLARKKWPGTEINVVDLIMGNWRSHLNMTRLPQDVDVSALRNVIQQRVDEADDVEKAVLDQWARIMRDLL